MGCVGVLTFLTRHRLGWPVVAPCVGAGMAGVGLQQTSPKG